MGTNYFKLLRLKPDANGRYRSITTSSIRKAYRALALKTHPDKVGAAGAEAFVKIQEAYECLINDDTREAHICLLEERQLKDITENQQLFVRIPVPGRPDETEEINLSDLLQDVGFLGDELIDLVLQNPAMILSVLNEDMKYRRLGDIFRYQMVLLSFLYHTTWEDPYQRQAASWEELTQSVAVSELLKRLTYSESGRGTCILACMQLSQKQPDILHHFKEILRLFKEFTKEEDFEIELLYCLAQHDEKTAKQLFVHPDIAKLSLQEIFTLTEAEKGWRRERYCWLNGIIPYTGPFRLPKQFQFFFSPEKCCSFSTTTLQAKLANHISQPEVWERFLEERSYDLDPVTMQMAAREKLGNKLQELGEDFLQQEQALHQTNLLPAIIHMMENHAYSRIEEKQTIYAIWSHLLIEFKYVFCLIAAFTYTYEKQNIFLGQSISEYLKKQTEQKQMLESLYALLPYVYRDFLQRYLGKLRVEFAQKIEASQKFLECIYWDADNVFKLKVYMTRAVWDSEYNDNNSIEPYIVLLGDEASYLVETFGKTTDKIAFFEHLPISHIAEFDAFYKLFLYAINASIRAYQSHSKELKRYDALSFETLQKTLSLLAHSDCLDYRSLTTQILFSKLIMLIGEISKTEQQTSQLEAFMHFFITLKSSDEENPILKTYIQNCNHNMVCLFGFHQNRHLLTYLMRHEDYIGNEQVRYHLQPYINEEETTISASNNPYFFYSQALSSVSDNELLTYYLEPGCCPLSSIDDSLTLWQDGLYELQHPILLQRLRDAIIRLSPSKVRTVIENIYQHYSLDEVLVLLGFIALWNKTPVLTGERVYQRSESVYHARGSNRPRVYKETFEELTQKFQFIYFILKYMPDWCQAHLTSEHFEVIQNHAKYYVKSGFVEHFKALFGESYSGFLRDVPYCQDILNLPVFKFQKDPLVILCDQMVKEKKVDTLTVDALKHFFQLYEASNNELAKYYVQDELIKYHMYNNNQLMQLPIIRANLFLTDSSIEEVLFSPKPAGYLFIYDEKSAYLHIRLVRYYLTQHKHDVSVSQLMFLKERYREAIIPLFAEFALEEKLQQGEILSRISKDCNRNQQSFHTAPVSESQKLASLWGKIQTASKQPLKQLFDWSDMTKYRQRLQEIDISTIAEEESEEDESSSETVSYDEIRRFNLAYPGDTPNNFVRWIITAAYRRVTFANVACQGWLAELASDNPFSKELIVLILEESKLYNKREIKGLTSFQLELWQVILSQVTDINEFKPSLAQWKTWFSTPHFSVLMQNIFTPLETHLSRLQSRKDEVGKVKYQQLADCKKVIISTIVEKMSQHVQQPQENITQQINQALYDTLSNLEKSETIDRRKNLIRDILKGFTGCLLGLITCPFLLIKSYRTGLARQFFWSNTKAGVHEMKDTLNDNSHIVPDSARASRVEH